MDLSLDVPLKIRESPRIKAVNVRVSADSDFSLMKLNAYRMRQSQIPKRKKKRTLNKREGILEFVNEGYSVMKSSVDISSRPFVIALYLAYRKRISLW